MYSKGTTARTNDNSCILMDIALLLPPENVVGTEVTVVVCVTPPPTPPVLKLVLVLELVLASVLGLLLALVLDLVLVVLVLVKVEKDAIKKRKNRCQLTTKGKGAQRELTPSRG
jgi:hypothetical protein